MWRTNDEMVRGLTRFSWVGAWIALGCAIAAFLLGVTSIFLSNTVWPSILIAGLASGLTIAMLGLLQRVHGLREQRKLADQQAVDRRSRPKIDEEKQSTPWSSQA